MSKSIYAYILANAHTRKARVAVHRAGSTPVTGHVETINKPGDGYDFAHCVIKADKGHTFSDVVYEYIDLEDVCGVATIGWKDDD